MGAITGVVLAALISAALSGWWYAHREEKVHGRTAAALLRGGALFLVLSSPWLPSLRGAPDTGRFTALLLDTSLSMSLPASGGATESRLERAADTARTIATTHPRVLAWSFGEDVAPFDPMSIASSASGSTIRSTDRSSRAVPAIEAARAAGADTVILVTDGEIEDREAARRLAIRYGVALHEIRVSDPPVRSAIRSIRASRTVSAGDTLDVEVEIVAQGTAGEPLGVALSGAGFDDARIGLEAPTANRATTGRLRIPVPRLGDDPEWRALDLRIEGVVEPWGMAAKRRVWVEVTPRRTGAVMVSLDPDWEFRYLLPVVSRAAPGRARAFVRVADGRFVSGGPLPEPGIEETTVRSAAERASLLVVQGSPANVPTWLARAMASRPAILFLARGPGRVPGAGIDIREALPGEWYVGSPPPAGPVSGYVAGVEATGQPPLLGLYGSVGRPDWVVLEARRDRTGDARPVATLGSAPGRRWAVVHGEGTWRWAARGGGSLELYRGLYAGVVNWLVEQAAPRPVRLEEAAPAAGEHVRWSVSPGVRDLTLTVRDSKGAAVWSDSLPDPPRSVEGPIVAAGDITFASTGWQDSLSFAFERPLHVGPASELIPRPLGPLLDTDTPARPSRSPARRPERPAAWPFAVAALLLCAEWLWRRRVGLR